MKNSVKIILLSFCMIIFSCYCCCDEEDCNQYGRRTVTYRVDSTTISNANVMFNNDYGLTELHPVSLPWEYTFTIKDRGKDFFGGDYDGYFPAFVSARNSGGQSGSINVAIYVGGNPVASSSTTSTMPTAQAYYNVEL